jgi:hypothetical protein
MTNGKHTPDWTEHRMKLLNRTHNKLILGIFAAICAGGWAVVGKRQWTVDGAY